MYSRFVSLSLGLEHAKWRSISCLSNPLSPHFVCTLAYYINNTEKIACQENFHKLSFKNNRMEGVPIRAPVKS